jgi:hypothetical protein
MKERLELNWRTFQEEYGIEMFCIHARHGRNTLVEIGTPWRTAGESRKREGQHEYIWTSLRAATLYKHSVSDRPVRPNNRYVRHTLQAPGFFSRQPPAPAKHHSLGGSLRESTPTSTPASGQQRAKFNVMMDFGKVSIEDSSGA